MLVRKLFTVSMALLFTSCYSKSVFIDYEVHHGAVWNNERTCVTFVASKKAYLSASGIARLPDGGIPKYLLKEVGLFVFNVYDKQLKQLVSFNDVTDWLGPSRSRWNVQLAFTDSVVFYSLYNTKWDYPLNPPSPAADSEQMHALKENYIHPYAIDISSLQKEKIDTSLFRKLYGQYNETNKADITELNKKLSEIPMADWGLLVKNIYPKPDKKYIEETIYLHNNSPKARRAVVEQIIAKMGRQEIETLLKAMDAHKNNLKGLKKTEYEIYSKDTYEWIKALL